ncbi:MAG: hypothetical protein WCZ10_10520 [Desulfobulbaceae bacterium]
MDLDLKFLRSETAFRRWSLATFLKHRDKTLLRRYAPKQYPCYGYLVVESFGYEEEMPKYLYCADILRMAGRIQKEEKTMSKNRFQPAYAVFNTLEEFLQEIAGRNDVEPEVRTAILSPRDMPVCQKYFVATARTTDSILRLCVFLGDMMDGDEVLEQKIRAKRQTIIQQIEERLRPQGLVTADGYWSLDGKFSL